MAITVVSGFEHREEIRELFTEYTKMLVETMVKAVTTTDPSYTLQSVYNTAPVF